MALVNERLLFSFFISFSHSTSKREYSTFECILPVAFPKSDSSSARFPPVRSNFDKNDTLQHQGRSIRDYVTHVKKLDWSTRQKSDTF